MSSTAISSQLDPQQLKTYRSLRELSDKHLSATAADYLIAQQLLGRMETDSSNFELAAETLKPILRRNIEMNYATQAARIEQEMDRESSETTKLAVAGVVTGAITVLCLPAGLAIVAAVGCGEAPEEQVDERRRHDADAGPDIPPVVPPPPSAPATDAPCGDPNVKRAILSAITVANPDNTNKLSFVIGHSTPAKNVLSVTNSAFGINFANLPLSRVNNGSAEDHCNVLWTGRNAQGISFSVCQTLRSISNQGEAGKLYQNTDVRVFRTDANSVRAPLVHVSPSLQRKDAQNRNIPNTTPRVWWVDQNDISIGNKVYLRPDLGAKWPTNTQGCSTYSTFAVAPQPEAPAAGECSDLEYLVPTMFVGRDNNANNAFSFSFNTAAVPETVGVIYQLGPVAPAVQINNMSRDAMPRLPDNPNFPYAMSWSGRGTDNVDYQMGLTVTLATGEASGIALYNNVNSPIVIVEDPLDAAVAGGANIVFAGGAVSPVAEGVVTPGCIDRP